MLTKVEVTNARGDVLSLPLSDFSGGYLVRDIQGLSPVKASLTSSSMAQNDGAQPQSSRRDTRNITAKIELKPNYSDNTVDSLRSDLYAYFLPKAVVSLAFYKDDALFASSVGTVESFDNNMFAIETVMALSVVHFDPDFYGPPATQVTGNTVADTTTHTINYPGTSDAGIIFTLNVNRTIAGFSLYNNRPDAITQQFDLTVPLVSGDAVTIVSIPGQKSVVKVHSGTTTQILYGVQPASSWLSLTKGDNEFRAAVSGAGIPWTIDYTPKYAAL